jgi:hypothetical protein
MELHGSGLVWQCVTICLLWETGSRRWAMRWESTSLAAAVACFYGAGTCAPRRVMHDDTIIVCVHQAVSAAIAERGSRGTVTVSCCPRPGTQCRPRHGTHRASRVRRNQRHAKCLISVLIAP